MTAQIRLTRYAVAIAVLLLLAVGAIQVSADEGISDEKIYIHGPYAAFQEPGMFVSSAGFTTQVSALAAAIGFAAFGHHDWRDGGPTFRYLLWYWDGSRWSGYAQDAYGRTVPGSIDFTIQPGHLVTVINNADGTRRQVRIEGSDYRRGIPSNRNVVGYASAPVTIVEYGDFL